MMHYKKFIGFMLGCLICGSVQAEVTLNPNHPNRYVVQPGDTLWGIAGHFLKNPWQWADVWRGNQHIANPNRIYPGDVLVFKNTGGRPGLHLHRPGGRPTIKVSPRVRANTLDRSIPTIPIGAIRQFLPPSRVVSSEQIDSAPYVMAYGGDHISGGPRSIAYVRGLEDDPEGIKYTLYRTGVTYKDPESNDTLGFEAEYVGDALLQRTGDPATFVITKAVRDSNVGDRLLPAEEDKVQQNFTPRAPSEEVSGQIISVPGGVSQIGQYQVVVLNLGEDDGMVRGTVLAIDQIGRKRRDLINPSITGEVELPPVEAGLLMVFRTFEHISYALVLEANDTIHLYDGVRNP